MLCRSKSIVSFVGGAFSLNMSIDLISAIDFLSSAVVRHLGKNGEKALKG